MKVVITGHTYGLGKALYEHFPNAHGLARSTGFDIEKDFDAVVSEINGCDLFINNAYANHSQVKLFNAVKDSVGKSIHMGSVIRMYRNKFASPYANNKQELYDVIQQHNQIPGSTPALHLDIGFLEKEVADDTVIQSTSFAQIINIVDVWLKDPFFTNVECGWKINDALIARLSNAHTK